MDNFLRLLGKDKHNFYKSQFNYYKKFNMIMVIATSLASITYFVSDCQLFGRFATETLIPRLSILLVLPVYIIAVRKWKNIYFNMVASELIGHVIMWCTIWAIWYLPNRQYASDGFILIQIVVMLLGFAATFEIAVVSQLMIMVNILVSNLFIHYEDFELMISLGLPCSVGIAITHLVLNQVYYEKYVVQLKLEKLSYMDQLTSVYNRHKLEELTNDNKLMHLDIQDISLILLDIDFFKMINDTYGHDKGDIVLKSLASIITKYTSSEDFVIRWGGEEFLIILYGQNEDEAYKTAEKIREEVQITDNGIENITVSLGVCKYDGLDYKETVNKADKALYRAKKTGRNKTVKFSDISKKYCINTDI